MVLCLDWTASAVDAEATEVFATAGNAVAARNNAKQLSTLRSPFGITRKTRPSKPAASQITLTIFSACIFSSAVDFHGPWVGRIEDYCMHGWIISAAQCLTYVHTESRREAAWEYRPLMALMAVKHHRTV